jgi:hypothetical protein
MLNIKDIRALCRDETIKATHHFTDRLIKRGIEYDNIIYAIMNGEIIENYPDDYPYPSVLIFGQTVEHDNIHIVAGLGDGELYLVTAYHPSNAKWENDYKTRRAVE